MGDTTPTPIGNLKGRTDGNGNLYVTGTFSLSGGAMAIADGVDANIKATVLDLATSNPQTVAIVDSTGAQISSFGGGTQYTEDAAAAANPVGTALNLIRQDTPTGLVSADGDNVAARGSDYGALYATLIDNAGNFVSVGGGTQYDQGTASTDTDKLTMAGVERRDTPAVPTGVADGDRTMLAVDAEGVLYCRLRQQLDSDTGAGTVPADVVLLGVPASGGVIAAGYISTSIATPLVTGSGMAHDAAATGATLVPPTLIGGFASAAAPTDVSADGDATRAWFLRNGAQACVITAAGALIPGDATNGLDADVTRVIPGTGATNLGKAEDAQHTSGDTGVFMLGVANEAQSTLAADADYIANATDTKGNTLAVGNLAHDAADAGNPIKVGAKAVDYGATPSAVAASDRTNLFSDRAGVQFMLGGHPDIVTLEAAYTSAQTDAAIVSVSSGTAIVVTQIQATCDEANTVGVGLRVGFAAANTPTTTGVVLTHPGMVPGSGISRGDGSSILGAGASGEDLRITSEVPTGGSLRILVSYFTIAIG